MTNSQVWTDCPYCHATASVEPFMVRPPMIWNADSSDERVASDTELRSECYNCDQIIVKYE